MSLLQTIKIPQDNVNDDAVIIKNIYVKNNQKITKDDILLDYETSKATVEVFSEIEGYVLLRCSAGNAIPVGEIIVEIFSDEVESFSDETISIEDKKAAVTFTKKAEQKIEMLNLDKKLFSDYEVVTVSIVNSILEQDSNNLKSEDKNSIKISPIKLSEISQLNTPDRSSLISLVSKKINASELDLESPYTHTEFKYSLGIILMKIAGDLLSTDKYKHLNGYYKDGYIRYNSTINFGLALNLGDGLRVGVIPEINSKTIGQIEDRVIDLVDKYIDSKLAPEDVSGSTVILTDLTDQNIDYFHPLLVKNTSIMFGLCGLKKSIQSINIAFDHRITDGLEVSHFLNAIIDKIQKQFKGILDKYSCSFCLSNLEENKNLKTPGLIKIIDSNSSDKYVCRNCLEGW